MVYTVVVCPDCQYSWIVQDRPGRTSCGRCQTSHQFKKLRKFYSSESKEAAAKVRAKVQAEVDDNLEEYESASERGVLDVEVEEAIEQDEYLQEKGVELDELEEVEDRATRSPGRSRSQKEIVRDGVKEQESPTEAEVVSYATEHDVEAEKAREILEKLVRGGEVSGSSSSGYRVL